MSFVMTQPDSLAAAADEVSASIAAQFAMHPQMSQQMSAQAAAIHEVFTTTLAFSADTRAATEAAKAIAAGSGGC
ncbi:PE family protein [Mycobacterium sp.]|uniref:PE family protein n=1 Tax=Mycobacterium sp. TaxID=1785 RepID=UPI003F9981FE